MAEDAFVDDVRGGVLETDRDKQARQEEVGWCRGVDVWEAILRKDMDAEGAKAASLRWIDTDKGCAGRPNYRSRLVVREVKKTTKKSDVLSAAELTSGMPPLESVKALLFSFRLPQSGRGEGQANSCDVRHQPCALPWSTSATSATR